MSVPRTLEELLADLRGKVIRLERRLNKSGGGGGSGGQPVYDSGWVDLVPFITFQPGWSFNPDSGGSSGIKARRVGAVVQIMVHNVTAEAGTFNIPVHGNISNSTIFTGLPAEFRPAQSAALATGTAGQTASMYVSTSGSLVLSALAPNATLTATIPNPGDSFSGTGSYFGAGTYSVGTEPPAPAPELPNRLGNSDGDIASLGPNVDLNAVTATGWYIQSRSADATTALNYPLSKAGHLEVSGGFMGTGADFFLQNYTEYLAAYTGQPARQWRRTHYQGTWQPWYELQTSANGFLLFDTLYFRSNATFSKGSYPGLQAVKVKVQGGGGGGGSCSAAAAGQNSAGAGGGGGGYAESFILASALGSSVAVTVGAGAVAAPVGSDGSAGGTSSFGTAVVATGGGGGFTKASSTLGGYIPGGDGGDGTAGDLQLGGGGGGSAWGLNTLAAGGMGGASHMGGGGRSVGTGAGAGANAGPPGRDYGGGGGGAASNAAGPGRTGGPGGPGIVIVELYR